jgi:hypothetical protein
MPQSTSNGMRPKARHVSEDVEPVDCPLFRAEPDKKLQHHTLLWVGIISLAVLTCVCVVAISGSTVPIPLLAIIAIVVATMPVIVKYVFPSGRR